ncbi:MAG TPA: glycoside hydrolase domain-containing protein [Trebonia sp.]
MALRGIDYAFSPHPATALITGNGNKFVGRYMSPDAANDHNGKNLLAGELQLLLGAGLSVIVVEESTAQRILGGHDAGVADAQHGDAVVKALGMAGMPVYFGCDFDAAPQQQDSINDYLRGAASVIGVRRVGLYSGFWPMTRAFNAGLITYGWQAYAWSAVTAGMQDPPQSTQVSVDGREFWFDVRAQVRQVGGVTIGDASCDIDEAVSADFGQWPRPATAPTPTSQFPVPASLSAAVHPAVAVSWASSNSPRWRVQVAADDGGNPGAVIDGGQVVVTAPQAVVPLPGSGRYWVRVQAAGDSPFTDWHSVTA